VEPEFPTSSYVVSPEWPLIKGGRWRKVAIPIRYGFFNHPRMGPVLIDTGYTTRVTEGVRTLDLRLYSAGLRPRLVPEGQLQSFLEARGLSREDVTAVILTHFHADHISACRDLPNARFHASGAAFDWFTRCSHLRRILHGVFLDLLPADFQARFTPFERMPTVEGPNGLGACQDVFGDGSVLVAPLPGHAVGHAGIVFPGSEPPLLYAADTEWLRGALPAGRSGIAARLVGHDRHASQASRDRVLAFEKAGGRVILCHDPESRA
jgi:glyoxylase-like metal-dependent hydrolase (beta-lactamase superfamily II)